MVREAEAEAGHRPDLLTTSEARAPQGARARGEGVAARQRDPQGRLVFSPPISTRPGRSERVSRENCCRSGFEPICRTLGVSASACYEPKGERSQRAIEDERVLAKIREVYEA
jgi:hypothetical protein